MVTVAAVVTAAALVAGWEEAASTVAAWVPAPAALVWVAGSRVHPPAADFDEIRAITRQVAHALHRDAVGEDVDGLGPIDAEQRFRG